MAKLWIPFTGNGRQTWSRMVRSLIYSQTSTPVREWYCSCTRVQFCAGRLMRKWISNLKSIWPMRQRNESSYITTPMKYNTLRSLVKQNFECLSSNLQKHCTYVLGLKCCWHNLHVMITTHRCIELNMYPNTSLYTSIVYAMIIPIGCWAYI